MTGQILFLQPADGRLSFYGKCYVAFVDNECRLFSFNSLVATYNRSTRSYVELDGVKFNSRTTKRHKKAFLEFIKSAYFYE